MASTSRYNEARDAFREAAEWFGADQHAMKTLCEGLTALTNALKKDLNDIESEIRSIQIDVRQAVSGTGAWLGP